MKELIPIERKSEVTLYGRVIDGFGRLGQFEVHSDVLGHDGAVYSLYKDAEKRFSALVGAQSTNYNKN